MVIKASTVEVQWLEYLGNHEKILETGVVRANECLSQRKDRRHNMDISLSFSNMKVCCVSSLESPHRVHTTDLFDIK